MGAAGYVLLVTSGLLVTIGMGAMMVFLLWTVTWDTKSTSLLLWSRPQFC